MKIRKLLTLFGSILLFGAVFIIDATMKSLDADLGNFTAVRGALVILAFILGILYIETLRKENQLTMIQRIGRIAAWAGVFVALSIIASVLRFNEFETRAFKLLPERPAARLIWR